VTSHDPATAGRDQGDRWVTYTATITTFDGGSLADGEPCEPGFGYRMDSGFWDFRHYWKVFPHRDQVRVDTWPGRGDPVSWLVDRLIARLGGVDSHGFGSFTGIREAIYPARLTGSRSNLPGLVFGTGTFLGDALASHHMRRPKPGLRTIRVDAHADGFSNAELQWAAELLGLH
jgi:hypothetical protein